MFFTEQFSPHMFNPFGGKMTKKPFETPDTGGAGGVAGGAEKDGRHQSSWGSQVT